MTQLSGSVNLEIPTDRISREVAAAVVELWDSAGLVAAIAAAVAGELRATGGETYERGEGSPDPGAGPRRGVAGFGDVTDSGVTPA